MHCRLLRAATLLVGCALAACEATTQAESAAVLTAPPDAPGPNEMDRTEPTDTTEPERSARSNVDAQSRGPSTAAWPKPGVTPPVTAPMPDLFDPDTVPHFELTFDAAAMAILASTAEADKETWVHASFKMGSIAYADVGVRRKGSSTFRALPQKASFKVKLNKYVKKQNVYGLTELTLNNQINSGSFLSERVAYHVFRSLGLPAPRSNSARVTINGEDYGLYLNVETPDSKFLSRVFGANGKTLYEANWGGDWVPGNEGSFESDVEDPTAPAGTRPDLTALFQTVAAANNQTLLADVAARLDTTEWLRFTATEAVVSHWDGYAFNQGASKNYFLAGDMNGKFTLVPWSTDLTFPLEHTVVDASMPTSATLLQRCKLTTACWTAYKTEAKWVVDEIEKIDLVTLAKKWHTQIDPLVKADPKRETSLQWYQQRTTGLYQYIDTRPGVVRKQLGI